MANNVTKTELIEMLAKEVECSKAQASKFLSSFINTIEISLKKGRTVQIIGFLSFAVTERKAREGRNPKTGAVVKIAKSKTVKVKVGKALKDSVK